MKKKLKKIFLISCFVFGMITLTSCSHNKEKEILNNASSIINTHPDKAIIDLNELKEKGYELQEVNRELGIAYFKLGDYDKALLHINNALKLSTKNFSNIEKDCLYYKTAIYMKQNKYNEALDTINSLLDMKQESLAYYEQGLINLEIGKKNEAITSFNEMLKLDNDKLDDYIDVYNAMKNSGYNQTAINYLDNAIEKNKKNTINLGIIYYYKGDYNEAIKLLGSKMNDKEANSYLLKAFYKNNDFKSAINLADNNINDNKANKECYNIKGLCQMHDDEYSKALSTFDDGLNVEEDNIELDYVLKYNQAVCYEYLLDFKTAKEKMDEIVKKYPNLKEAKREYIFLKTR